MAGRPHRERLRGGRHKPLDGFWVTGGCRMAGRSPGGGAGMERDCCGRVWKWCGRSTCHRRARTHSMSTPCGRCGLLRQAGRTRSRCGGGPTPDPTPRPTRTASPPQKTSAGSNAGAVDRRGHPANKSCRHEDVDCEDVAWRAKHPDCEARHAPRHNRVARTRGRARRDKKRWSQSMVRAAGTAAGATGRLPGSQKGYGHARKDSTRGNVMTRLYTCGPYSGKCGEAGEGTLGTGSRTRTTSDAEAARWHSGACPRGPHGGRKAHHCAKYLMQE